jgi:hypothetical protein
MRDTGNELSQIIGRFAAQYIEQYHPNGFIIRTLDALQKCRTSALGGHKERCDCCGRERISYNSCRNRHCPKCQAAKQAFWIEDRMKDALGVKYFHVVFTVPHDLNALCMTAHLSGVEFLHRFCLHILLRRFVRIWYFGIVSSKVKKSFNPEKQKPVSVKEISPVKETSQDRLKRLTQFDVYQCPYCKKGRMQIVEVLPKIRSPGNVLYPVDDKRKNLMLVS